MGPGQGSGCLTRVWNGVLFKYVSTYPVAPYIVKQKVKILSDGFIQNVNNKGYGTEIVFNCFDSLLNWVCIRWMQSLRVPHVK